jgi:plastocyanin
VYYLAINFNSSFAASAGPKYTEVKIVSHTDTSQPSVMKYSFVPSVVSLNLGDTVKWINTDKINHTITSVFFNSHIIYPQSSGKFPSSFSYTLTRPGIYVYTDRLNPVSAGVVYVNASETQRELVPTSINGKPDIRVEMPRNAAYKNDLGTFFIPSFLNTSQGAKVTWSNKDYIPHTATAIDGSFDTQTILTGQSITKVMNSTGIHLYYCEIHPWMMAIIDVTKSSQG